MEVDVPMVLAGDDSGSPGWSLGASMPWRQAASHGGHAGRDPSQHQSAAIPSQLPRRGGCETAC